MIFNVTNLLKGGAALNAFQAVRATSSILNVPAFLSVWAPVADVPIHVRAAALRCLQKGARAHRSAVMAKMASMLDVGHAFSEIMRVVKDEVERIQVQQMIDSERKDMCEDMRLQVRRVETALFHGIEAKRSKETGAVGKFRHLKHHAICTLSNNSNDLQNSVMQLMQKTESDYSMNGDDQAEEVGLRAGETKSHQRRLADVVAVERILQSATADLKMYYGSSPSRGVARDDHEDVLQAVLTPRLGQEEGEKGEDALSLVVSLMEEVTTEHALLDEDGEDAAWGHSQSVTRLQLESTSLHEKLHKLNRILAALEKGGPSQEELSSILLHITTITTGCDYDAQSYALRADSRTLKLGILDEVEGLLDSRLQ